MLRIGTNKLFWIVMSVLLATPRWAFACAACVGRSDAAAVHGLNAAVLTLLGVLLMVLGGILASMIYLIFRSAKHPLALPGVPEGVVR